MGHVPMAKIVLTVKADRVYKVIYGHEKCFSGRVRIWVDSELRLETGMRLIKHDLWRLHEPISVRIGDNENARTVEFHSTALIPVLSSFFPARYEAFVNGVRVYGKTFWV